MNILAIDPGKRSLAWAFFHHGELIECGFTNHRRAPFEVGTRDMLQSVDLPADPDVVVIERPKIYPRNRNKRPNDLIDLALTAGACVIFGTPVFVTPQEWKGQVPKEISGARTKKELSSAELLVLRRWNKNHNVLDAVGIGRWYVSHLH